MACHGNEARAGDGTGASPRSAGGPMACPLSMQLPRAHRRSTSCADRIRPEAVAASCHTTETESAPFCARSTVRVFLTAPRGGA